ncbi:hypothetical protein UlMin_017694 [Ulmus minor]
MFGFSFEHCARVQIRRLSTQQHFSRECLFVHHSSSQQSYMEISQKFYQALKACSSLSSIPLAQKLHAQLISTGLDSSIFLQNHLLHIFLFYTQSKVFTWNTMINGLLDSGRIRDAEKLFDEMPVRDSVSWTTMMSGYFRNGRIEDTMIVFASMFWCCKYVSDPFSFTCAMKACASLGFINLARQLRGLVEKFDFGSNMPIQSSVIDMYINMIYGYSKLYGIGKAFDMFTQMPERDSVSWNTMISIFSQHNFGIESLGLFVEMWKQGFKPNSITYASILRACTSLYDLGWGTHLHARIVRTEPNLDVLVGGGLIDMYAKCGHLRFARKVFNSLKEHNAVSWTSLISGVAQFGLEEETVVLFNQMRESFLGACSAQKHVLVGEQLHGYLIKARMDSVPVGNALVVIYAQYENSHKVNRGFDLMPIKDVISWTSMITAYSQVGNVEKAQEYFNKMPERNIITWNSMLTTYVQNGYWEEGLKLYNLMQREGVDPDWVTYATTISACADLAVYKLGIQIVALAEKLGFGSNASVANSVVTMYSKCGRMEEAQKVFDSIDEKNLISWNALMSGYAQNGQGRKVIEVFEDMLSMDCNPDHISYTSVLSGCSHSGLVTEGKYYFSSMNKDFGICPASEHYSCMVDLLGRAGLLEEAKNLIDGFPFKPNVAIWGAFLSACRIHRNSKLVEFAARNLLELEVEDSGGYVLLANIYSDSGNSEGFAGVRNLMRKIQKNPGCSWVEVDNRVHVFTVDDTDHPQTKDIYIMMEDINRKIEGIGHYHGPTNSNCSEFLIPKTLED